MGTTHRIELLARRRPQGLTLLELLIVVAITAVVAASAAPSFSALLEARRLESAAMRLAADIQFVRSEAITRNRSLRLSVQAGEGASCWIVHTGAAADCRCDAAVATCNGSARVIRSVVLPGSDRVGLSANVGSMLFDPLHGTITPTGTLRLAAAHAGTVHHVVNVLGRVRSCSPGATVPGYPAC